MDPTTYRQSDARLKLTTKIVMQAYNTLITTHNRMVAIMFTLSLPVWVCVCVCLCDTIKCSPGVIYCIRNYHQGSSLHMSMYRQIMPLG